MQNRTVDLDDLKNLCNEISDLIDYRAAMMAELYNQGFSWQEIGDTMGCTRQGARNTVMKAGYKLNKRLMKYDG